MSSSTQPLTPLDVLMGNSKSPASPTPLKGVVLVDEPDEIIPPPVYDDERPDSSTSRQHKASISGKKMTGRPSLNHYDSSSNLVRKTSGLNLNGSEGSDAPWLDPAQTDAKRILAQVAEWLHQQKSKTPKKKKRRRHRDGKTIDPEHNDDENKSDSEPAGSGSGSDLNLEVLEGILAGYAKSSTGSTPRLLPKSPNLLARKGSIAKAFKRSTLPPQSSDTEFFGEDILVPNVEADLDNTKTLAYSGGAADADVSEKAKKKDQKHWNKFKQDILRLTHTLKLKGWRRIPMENGGELEVSRLSGALTNAVYVVKPPKKMPEDTVDGAPAKVSKRQPMQLLLRIYGPQVDHLINRSDELAILRRLARKRIGPRMLGTFSNGRFEEYLHARTLEAEDLRVPETSKQIAKRMRELHEGIELLDSEVDGGPTIFLNWDKWVDRCERVISWLDKQVHQAERENQPKPKAEYTRLGLVCGVEWPVFRQTYDKYRSRLIQESGGDSELRRKLIFAHNDTQYGNLMRLIPSGESPLLHPVNHHKQLVVIDFEYAGQNTVGLEFANHFTEWCYNYHHAEKPWACNTKVYPTPEEQYRFVRSYVMHRPQYNPTASATPKMEARETTSISDFMLDARAQLGTPGVDYDAEETAREKKVEEDIQKLLHETRLWRIANSAQWVAWGIVQAKVPELDEPKKSVTAAVVDKVKHTLHPRSDPLDQEEQEQKENAKHDRPEGRAQEEAHAEGDEEDHEEFDYLAYAQERAMFFWGDCLQMGLIKEEEMPESMKSLVKIVPH